MSNFTCEHCGANICDSPHGYVTGCEHYPMICVELAALAKDQEPLGAEFEAVWDAHADDLYEP